MTTEQPAERCPVDSSPNVEPAVCAERPDGLDNNSTQLLLRRIQDGDHVARNELFERYMLPVLFLVRINLGRSLRAKLESWDIVQEVFIKSLNGLEDFRYERDGAFRRHLSLIVMQVIRDKADFWSAAKRSPQREQPMVAGHDSQHWLCDQLPDPLMDSPSAQISLDEDLNRLAGSLDILAEEAPEMWEIIVAVKLVGQSLKDVADERGTTADAIKMKVRRGMVKLARVYRKQQDQG